mgnify:CR=1 FL=1
MNQTADIKRPVFFISDRTGITAETLGNALLSQFDVGAFNPMTLPFINSIEKAQSTLEYVSHAGETSGLRPIIFSTTVTDEVREVLKTTDAMFLDLFDTYIDRIEHELDMKSADVVGRVHGASNEDSYRTRIDAMNFALQHDDGASDRDYDKADVIIIAPSRCGKTPTCIYMAMQHGQFAANYPLTPDDLERKGLPRMLAEYQHKLYGLTSDVDQLHRVRSERRPGSEYASVQQVGYELRQAEALYRKFGIPFVNSNAKSIEELATIIMQEKALHRITF